MTKPLVTVVIPTYCRSEFLNYAIKSAISQTYPNIEIIVVNDNVDTEEKQKVKNVVNSFLGKVKGITNTRSKGGCGARNCGIEAATGDFIAFLDDDDIWFPEKIELQVDLIISNQMYSGVSSEFIERDNIIGIERVESDGFSEMKLEDALAGVCPSSTSLLLIRKDVLIAAGLFDENMPSFQDFDMWLRCLPFGPFGCVKKPLVKFVQHDGDRTSVNLIRRIAGLDAIEKKWATKMIPFGGFQKFKRRMISGVLFANGRACFGKRYFKSITFFFRASIKSGFKRRPIFWLFLALCGKSLGLIVYRYFESCRISK